MDLNIAEKPRFYFATVVSVELTAETAFPAGVYTFAVKSRRSVTDPLIALSTATLSEPTATLSAELDFGTESGLAQAQAGDLEAWLEISTSSVVIYQREVLYLPRVYDGSTPAPTPVTIYYTAAEVDALIAAIPAAPVTSVNGKTGEVELDAGDVGAISAAGKTIETLTATSGVVTVPTDESKVYFIAPAPGDTITPTAPAAGKMLTAELHITMPSTAVAFDFGVSIRWADGDEFPTTSTAPDFSTGSREYAIVLRYDGSDWIANIAYTKELE